MRVYHRLRKSDVRQMANDYDKIMALQDLILDEIFDDVLDEAVASTYYNVLDDYLGIIRVTIDGDLYKTTFLVVNLWTILEKIYGQSIKIVEDVMGEPTFHKIVFTYDTSQITNHLISIFLKDITIILTGKDNKTQRVQVCDDIEIRGYFQDFSFYGITDNIYSLDE